MNPARVQLTSEARASAFWRSDPFRNAVGFIVGPYADKGAWRVVFVRAAGWKREFHLRADSLCPAFE